MPRRTTRVYTDDDSGSNFSDMSSRDLSVDDSDCDDSTHRQAPVAAESGHLLRVPKLREMERGRRGFAARDADQAVDVHDKLESDTLAGVDQTANLQAGNHGAIGAPSRSEKGPVQGSMEAQDGIATSKDSKTIADMVSYDATQPVAFLAGLHSQVLTAEGIELLHMRLLMSERARVVLKATSEIRALYAAEINLLRSSGASRPDGRPMSDVDRDVDKLRQVRSDLITALQQPELDRLQALAQAMGERDSGPSVEP